MDKHTILGGKVHVYKRENSQHWQCSTYMAGKNRRRSTKEDSLSRAKEVAEDWYLELRGKNRIGELKNEKTFKFAAKQFEHEYEIITEGQRNAVYVRSHKDRIRVRLNPFFGDKGLSEVTPGLVQDYRIHRMKAEKPPARNTLHHEIVTLRQVLKTAIRHGWLQYLPDLSPPYKMSTKISHRAWFNHDDYKTLYEATRERAKNPIRERYRHNGEQLHDMVLFMANTGIRPDEALRLEYRDVEIVEDIDTDETILVISVRGKRGVGFCKSTNGAVRPFERLKERNKPSPEDRLFPTLYRELLNTILEEENLKIDREGNRRTAYSLRHSYICFRLMEGADIYQIAKNCRTSVEMIEKYYASHIQNSINAAAINVRRPTKKKKPAS